MTRLHQDPRLRSVLQANCDLANMLANADLYCAEELLGVALLLARQLFDIAGCGEDETQRRALADALAAYVDVPRLTVVGQGQAA